MPKPGFWALALLFALATTSIPVRSAAFDAGEPLPHLSGKTLDGDQFDLASLKGKPVLLKVGTTWCGTCQQQSKAIHQIAGFLKSNDVHYVEVFIQESETKVRKYLKRDGMSMPDTVILDEGDISRQLNIYLIPRVILIDREQKVFRDGDSLPSKNLKKQLQTLLDSSQ